MYTNTLFLPYINYYMNNLIWTSTCRD